MIRRTLRSVAEMLLAGVLALLVLSALLLTSGYPVSPALAALWDGAFGSWSAVASGTLLRATPLLFAGLAVSIAFRAGVLNIGAEGQLLMGACGATAIAAILPASLGVVGTLLVVTIGALAGSVWAAVPALLRLRFGVLEVISTIMLNVVALHATGLLVRGALQEPTRTFPQSALIDSAFRLPQLMPPTRLHAGVVLAVMLALFTGWWLRTTASGFRLRMTGDSASAG